MARPIPSPPQHAPPLRPAILVALGAVALACVAFVAGRSSVETAAGARARPGAERAGQRAGLDRAGSREARSAAAPAAGAAGAAGEAPALPTRGRTAAAPEVVARIREDAVQQLDELRPHAVASCWPREGLANGRTRTTLTYHLTFDPDGREIARGIQDDRGAPAGAFARCLRRLGDTSLSVSRTGAFVSMKIPVAYP